MKRQNQIKFVALMEATCVNDALTIASLLLSAHSAGRPVPNTKGANVISKHERELQKQQQGAP